jgi:murein DD-endopeptidase MepM/ murein hydrolase activator NlpD
MAVVRLKLYLIWLLLACVITLSCSLFGGLTSPLFPTATQIKVPAQILSPSPSLTPKVTAFPSITPTSIPTQIVQTSAPLVSATSEPSPVIPSATASLGDASLQGVIFFDYDGDGLHEDTESGIPGVLLCLDLPEVRRCTITADDGSYRLDGLPEGQQRFFISGPSDDPAKAFRYFNLFKGWQEIPGYEVRDSWVDRQELPVTELHHIGDPLKADLLPGTVLDVGLTQGFLTDIFSCDDRERVQTYQAYDLDPIQGYVRNYFESESRTINGGGTVLNGDNHFAIDWGSSNEFLVGTPLYAPSNGIVIFAGIDRTSMGDCLVVNLAHPETGSSSGVLHLDKVLVREQQKVLRGQLIGTLGQSCATWPHAHFFLRSAGIEVNGQWEGIDPYRDTANTDSFSYWTKDNDPQCLTDVK